MARMISAKRITKKIRLTKNNSTFFRGKKFWKILKAMNMKFIRIKKIIAYRDPVKSKISKQKNLKKKFLLIIVAMTKNPAKTFGCGNVPYGRKKSLSKKEYWAIHPVAIVKFLSPKK